MRTEQASFRTTMKKLNGDSLTPILIFRRLKGERKFLLESSAKHDSSGRYSFIGVNPLKSYTGRNGKLIEHFYENGKEYTHEGNVFDLLKRLIPSIPDNTGLPFTGGAVGYISYEAGRNKKSTLEDEIGLPSVYFNVYETLVIFDHQLDEVTLINTDIGSEREIPNLDSIEDQILLRSEEKEGEILISEYACSVTQQQFEDLVRKAKDYIEKGEVEQVVLSRRLVANFTGDPFSLYRKLRKRNPSPYMYYMEFDDHVIVGTSPESLVQVIDRKVVTNPIAGTRRRGRTAEEDVSLEKELLSDPKEISEHNMLVDLSIKELGKVCVPESVQVINYKKLVRYEHVMHIVSEVEGILSPVLHPLDGLMSCFPAGTVTGSPKQRSIEIIEELEFMQRSFYGGSIGYIGFNGNMDFALTIRTMLLKDGKVFVQAGAGIVAESKPKLEYKETFNKARSLLEVLN
ncbi:anthranilate synthase component I family protein [Psychrobacillus glaciei]|uniref:Anthranilate synthase component 1 n=1 Tax=Psychrobacillus glaciei TaxID=2283160 RepID=A0A5J6SMB1_9BACI|nr:chorismate-binding protein [Psychrobacillus glaciei]QFF99038.1 anthranilate synthase component I family protein [Psychrobacillus glaciei]